jgi:HEXXH motif-containing protein
VTRPHHLGGRDFDLLAAGYGDAATIRALRAGQLSKHLLLLRAVDRVASDVAPAERGAAHFSAAYSLLARLQRAVPDVVCDLLLHPHTGAWLCHCLERLHGADPQGASQDTSTDPPGASLTVDLAHLASLAAAAAIRAHVPFQIPVPVRAGLVMLPALGAAAAAGTEAVVRRDGDHADIVSAAGAVRVWADRRGSDGWLPLRRIEAAERGQRLRVDLDDLDPFRGHNYPSVSPRLGEEEAAAWQTLMEQAWRLLAEDHAGHAEAIMIGLRSLVPQHSDDPQQSISATSTDAFGSVALSRPADGAALAVTLVHEFQHAKLSALLDIVPLCEASPRTRYYAPWRDDPRPLGGLLQGAYAFLGVTDFWRIHRHRVGGSRERTLSGFEFARWREQTTRACDELAAATELTAAGRRFVQGMAATLGRWRNEPVPRDLAAQARDSAAEHRAGWRIRNLRPDAGTARALAMAWMQGAPAPTVRPEPGLFTGSPPTHTDTARLQLWHLKVTSPAEFRRLCREPGAHCATVPRATPADVTYVQGLFADAASAYRAQIEASAEVEAGPWVGLALARRNAGDAGIATALLETPELLLAVHKHLRELGIAADPEALARWMTTLTSPHEGAMT